MELSEAIKVENESTKSYLVQSTNRATAHRETLQVKYDEKLERIKDVCAQYFSKYERQLVQAQDQIKFMDKRQEEWINTLLKP